MTDGQQTARKLYKRLLLLYPRAFREELGASMEQTFHDLCIERGQQTGRGLAGLVLWMVMETALGIVKEHVHLIKQGDTMQALNANPRSLALTSLLLALPGALLLTLLVLGIEPPLGPLAPVLNNPNPDQPDVLGSLVALSLIVPLPTVALSLNLVPIVRTLRAGGSLRAQPLNVALAVAAFLPIIAFILGVIIDQYPCWIGVPNCD